jgi:dTDP-4-dehydrorhamnose 3,5-epimerase
MIFTETKLAGAFVIDPEHFEDERGFFALCWSEEKFAARGLNPRSVETNISFNRKEGTLRGMHFQIAPHAQPKLVRCTAGAIYDVIIDLRPESVTFKQWTAVELTAANHRQIYIPEGFAHGFQTRANDTEVLYQMSAPYVPTSARGVRWNDSTFAIDWPAAERFIIARDQTYPDFTG